MYREIHGKTGGEGKRVGIVVARWNELITSRLLEGALGRLRASGVVEEDITVVWCPGAFELPVVLSRLAGTGKFDGLIGLGAVIQGDTPHFDYVCSHATNGMGRISLDTGIPVGFGLLTLATEEQGLSRAGLKGGNKGHEAADAVIEVMSIFEQLNS